MEQRPEGALRHFLLQYRGGVGFRLAAMDDERQARLARSLYVDAKAPGLLIARAVIIVIIETGLADAHDLRMLRQPHQLFGRDIGLLGGIVRMGADGAEDVGVALRDGENLVELTNAGA